jgi:hypothetical protein
MVFIKSELIKDIQTDQKETNKAKRQSAYIKS